jgi:cytoskeleton protein RodZ
MAEPAKKSRSASPSSANDVGADVVALPEVEASRADVVRLSEVVPSEPSPAAVAPTELDVVPDAPADLEDDGDADIEASEDAPDEPIDDEDDGPTTDVARALRRARTARGMTIEEAAEATCITVSYLRALEDDAPVSVFPAPAYARFFVREYAQYLGLDAEDLVDRFVAHHGIVDEAVLAETSRPVLGVRSRWPVRALAAASVALLVLLAAFAIGRSASHTTPIMPLPPSAGGSTAAAGGDAESSSQNHPDGGAARALRIELRVVRPTWVRAAADGKTILSRTLPAGRSLTLRADEAMDVRLGNAAGVRVSANGTSVSTGGRPGDVVNLSFAVRHGKVVQLHA